MKLSRFVLILALFAAIFSGVAYAATEPCTDGTPYYHCSTARPGFRCTPNGLQQDLTCKCEDVAGYITQGSAENTVCVLASCGSVATGTCDSANKPKYCALGTLIDNSTKCGCPVGQNAAADGLTCAYPPCDDHGTSVINNQCAPITSGKKCVNGQMVDKASDCPCKPGTTKIGEQCLVVCSDGTQDGQCSATTKPKVCTNGYLLDNSTKCGCPDGQVVVGTRCGSADDLGSTDAGNSDILGGIPPGAGFGTDESGNPLSCCCLPAALIGIVGGFAVFRKN